MEISLFIIGIIIIFIYVIVPTVKLTIADIKYKKSKREYSEISEEILKFMKEDISGPKLYRKEIELYLEILSRNLYKSVDCDNPTSMLNLLNRLKKENEENSKELFNTFKNIIPKFREIERNKKLNQILK